MDHIVDLKKELQTKKARVVFLSFSHPFRDSDYRKN